MTTKSVYDTISYIMMTEKGSLIAAKKQYAFKVSPRATKADVAAAVEKIYGVKVKSVNIMNYKGKPKRAGRSPIMGVRADWKKAVVTLLEGTIELA